MHDARNITPLERAASFAASAAAAAVALRTRGPGRFIAGAAAAELFYRAVTGYCPIFAALGIDTSDPRGARNLFASVPYGKGVRVEETIEVACPAKNLYEFWRRLDTLPQFMSHVEEVATLTPTRSRWRVRAPIGSRVTWEAEIINDVEGQFIAWRSMPGSAIHHAGSVHFDQRDGLTQVRVVLEYAPPARYFGASIALILGEEPHRQIAEDLRRFKAIVEQTAYA